jgi:hypothetical protein
MISATQVRVTPSGITRLDRLTKPTATREADIIDFNNLLLLIGVGLSGVLYHTLNAAPATAANTATIATSSVVILLSGQFVYIKVLNKLGIKKRVYALGVARGDILI